MALAFLYHLFLQLEFYVSISCTADQIYLFLFSETLSSFQLYMFEENDKMLIKKHNDETNRMLESSVPPSFQFWNATKSFVEN